MDYPKTLYHRHEAVITVQSAAEETLIGPGWADAPGAAQVTVGDLTADHRAAIAVLRERDRRADIARRQGR